MIKLRQYDQTKVYFEPPIPVEPFFGDIDVSWPYDRQIECLLWIPAALVSKFIGQYPFLQSEDEELFSVGVEKVVEIVTSEKYDSGDIGAVCTVACRRSMEEYGNRLNRIVRVSTSLLYKNRRLGKKTPKSVSYTSGLTSRDDRTETYMKDAAETLGIDLNNMSRRDKNELKRVLL